LAMWARLVGRNTQDARTRLGAITHFAGLLAIEGKDYPSHSNLRVAEVP